MNGSRSKVFPNADMRSSVSTATAGKDNSAPVLTSGKSTPGPWQANESADGHDVWVIHNLQGRKVGNILDAANARLIAAAPAMHRILKELADEHVGGVNPLRDWIDKARAVLAKIEGE